jgi:hypothetical protein
LNQFESDNAKDMLLCAGCSRWFYPAQMSLELPYYCEVCADERLRARLAAMDRAASPAGPTLAGVAWHSVALDGTVQPATLPRRWIIR